MNNAWVFAIKGTWIEKRISNIIISDHITKIKTIATVDHLKLLPTKKLMLFSLGLIINQIKNTNAINTNMESTLILIKSPAGASVSFSNNSWFQSFHSSPRTLFEDTSVFVISFFFMEILFHKKRFLCLP